MMDGYTINPLLISPPNAEACKSCLKEQEEGVEPNVEAVKILFCKHPKEKDIQRLNTLAEEYADKGVWDCSDLVGKILNHQGTPSKALLITILEALPKGAIRTYTDNVNLYEGLNEKTLTMMQQFLEHNEKGDQHSSGYESNENSDTDSLNDELQVRFNRLRAS